MKRVWIAVGLLGMIGGFMLMSLVYMVYLAANEKQAKPWAALIIGISGVVAGCLLSLKWQSKSVLFFTSFIGAYSLARGLSYLVGGLPSFTVLYYQQQ